MGLKFHKMTGLGNDFIFIDNFDGDKDLDPAGLARRLCPRGTSVGADGLVILEPDAEGEVDFQWRFHNSDGSLAEMCGNASRCAARLAHLLGRTGPEVAFRTVAGVIRAEVNGRIVKTQMTGATDTRAKIDLSVDGVDLDVGFSNTGVPHAVLFVDDVASAPLRELGPKVRNHPDFGAAGTNAMFVRVIDRHTIQMRSFERGVEDETQACGTGATAAALVAGLRGLVDSPTRVLVTGERWLIIHYDDNPGSEQTWPGEVYMEGDAAVVYTGETTGEV